MAASSMRLMPVNGSDPVSADFVVVAGDVVFEPMLDETHRLAVAHAPP